MHAKFNELEVRVIIKKSNLDKNHNKEFSEIIKSENTRVEGKRNDSDIHSDAILFGERRPARLQGTDALTDQAGLSGSENGAFHASCEWLSKVSIWI